MLKNIFPELKIIKRLEELGINLVKKDEKKFDKWSNIDSYVVKNRNVIALKISGRKITVDIFKEITKITHLQKLYLYKNQISSIPNSISELIHLRELDLSFNQIEKIPKSLSKLINLQELYLDNNFIEHIPTSLSNLNNLKKFDLLKTLIAPNLQKVENLTPQESISYIKSIQNSKKTQLNEAKLLVVGDERVGKTSIINRIIGKEFERNQKTTEGIDIDKYRLKNGVRLNIWDFAGQEITHQTHQFFLSTRSLYLLVLDAQEEDKDSKIYDWLETIKSNGKDSPIIIVVNKSDRNSYEFDINRYKKDFANIEEVIYTSAQDNINIDKLVKSIEKNIEKIKHVRDVLAEDWFRVKEELERLSNEDADYIEGARFEDICEANGVEKELDQQSLLTILHEIGTVVRYENKNLNNIQIINPVWITNAVYKIIRSKFLNSNATLNEKNFREIFRNDKRYKQRHYQWIIDLLIQFELAFRLNEERVLIPSKLPNNEPSFNIKSFQSGLNFRYKYEGQLKKSVISQFIVKMNKMISKNRATPYWQRGVFLEYRDCEAVVISEEEKKIISISINSKNIEGREFLSIIRHIFKDINGTKIDVDEEIPLIIDNKIVGFKSYEYLLSLEKSGIKTVPLEVKTGKKFYEFDISKLLYGYHIIIRKKKLPLVITEGKTDWKHFKSALRYFKGKGEFLDLELEFLEYENDVDMGDTRLEKRLKDLIDLPQDRITIGIFDCDTKIGKRYEDRKNQKLSEHIYAVSMPTPKFREYHSGICVEFLYRDEDLKKRDKNGRRIFLSSEFSEKGILREKNRIICIENTAKIKRYINKKNSKIIDNEIFSIDTEESIVLSKNSFAENILNQIEPFDKMNFDGFKAGSVNNSVSIR